MLILLLCPCVKGAVLFELWRRCAYTLSHTHTYTQTHSHSHTLTHAWFAWLIPLDARLVTCVDFGRMLATTSRLLEAVDEAHAFLPNNGSIDAAVDDCYHSQTEFAGQGELISTESFVEWALGEPDALCWLPTMHRIAAAESEQHDVRCSHEECVCACAACKPEAWVVVIQARSQRTHCNEADLTIGHNGCVCCCC